MKKTSHDRRIGLRLAVSLCFVLAALLLWSGLLGLQIFEFEGISYGTGLVWGYIFTPSFFLLLDVVFFVNPVRFPRWAIGLVLVVEVLTCFPLWSISFAMFHRGAPISTSGETTKTTDFTEVRRSAHAFLPQEEKHGRASRPTSRTPFGPASVAETSLRPLIGTI